MAEWEGRWRRYVCRPTIPAEKLVNCPKCNQSLTLSGMGMHSHFNAHVRKKELTAEEAIAMRMLLGDERLRKRIKR